MKPPLCICHGPKREPDEGVHVWYDYPTGEWYAHHPACPIHREQLEATKEISKKITEDAGNAALQTGKTGLIMNSIGLKTPEQEAEEGREYYGGGCRAHGLVECTACGEGAGNPLEGLQASIKRTMEDTGLPPRPPVFMSAANAEELYRQIREVQGERDRYRSLLVSILNLHGEHNKLRPNQPVDDFRAAVVMAIEKEIGA